MKILFLYLLLVCGAMASLLRSKPPRKLFIMTSSEADRKRSEQESRFQEEMRKQVQQETDKVGFMSHLQEINSDQMDTIHGEYINARSQIEYVKNFLNSKMDNIYNNFITYNRPFY